MNQVTKKCPFLSALAVPHTQTRRLSVGLTRCSDSPVSRPPPVALTNSRQRLRSVTGGDRTARRLKLSKSDRRSFWSDLAALWHKVSACVVWKPETPVISKGCGEGRWQTAGSDSAMSPSSRLSHCLHLPTASALRLNQQIPSTETFLLLYYPHALSCEIPNGGIKE